MLYPPSDLKVGCTPFFCVLLRCSLRICPPFFIVLRSPSKQFDMSFILFPLSRRLPYFKNEFLLTIHSPLFPFPSVFRGIAPTFFGLIFSVDCSPVPLSPSSHEPMPSLFKSQFFFFFHLLSSSKTRADHLFGKLSFYPATVLDRCSCAPAFFLSIYLRPS